MTESKTTLYCTQREYDAWVKEGKDMTDTLQEDSERLAIDIFNDCGLISIDPSHPLRRGQTETIRDKILEALQSAFNAGAEKMREKILELNEGWAPDYIDAAFVREIRNLPIPKYGED